jgi:hypothetical protein
MARGDAQVAFRVSAELKDWLQKEAEKNLRSVAAEATLAIREKMERANAPGAKNE